ncbi:hypothetical protein [Streptomyces sp. NPDC056468]|uniref:hypothetical protein n=1 Tax=Streptomyces sp. NPDC056468 TaxID=3345830 RepID=UPI0036CCF53D
MDATIQLASTGYGPGEDVTRALVGAELAVLVTAEGEPVRASAPDGTAVIPVFSAPAFLHRYGNLAYELVKTPDIIHRLPEDHSFYVNPSAQVSMVVDTQAVLDAIAETEKPATVPTREASVAEEPPPAAPRGDNSGENGPREAAEPEPPAPVRPSTVGGTDVPTTPAARALTEDENAEDENAEGSAVGLDSTS